MTKLHTVSRPARTYAILCLALAGERTLANAVVFSDSFDSEHNGVGMLNFAAFTKWTISDGSVDLIGKGFNDVFPGEGLYVDLDGSTNNAGVMTSIAIDLEPGEYHFAFQLGENPSEPATNTMTVSIGPFYSEVFTSADATKVLPLKLIERDFTVDRATSVSIVFDHAGADNRGLIIDDVRLIHGCLADANADGVLNILDFVAFQQLWQAADQCADCDFNGAFNILDFV
jgi:hypothetical protein